MHLHEANAISTAGSKVDQSDIDGLLGRTEVSEQDLKWHAVYGPKKVVCECGSDAIGGGSHSQWCPKHA